MVKNRWMLAFPSEDKSDGMTQRDYIATEALGRLILFSQDPERIDEICRLAYRFADSMMTVRDE